jgi:protoporphyrinogen oxidase
MFGYCAGGYATVLTALERRLRELGVVIRLNSPVQRVESAEDQRLVVTTAGRSQVFDQVISTLPAPLMSRVCPQLSADERRRFDGIRTHGIVCASLLLKRSLSPFYVTNITDPGYPFTGVIEMTALVDKSELNGQALVYLPRYVPPDDELFDRTDAEIEHEFLTGLQRMHPQLSLADVAAFRISRARHVFALPTLGYSKRLPPITTSVPGLFALNSAHIVNGTLNVNETIKLAEDFVAGLNSEVRTAPHEPVLHQSLVEV